jgi:hypothetical protein
VGEGEPVPLSPVNLPVEGEVEKEIKKERYVC